MTQVQAVTSITQFELSKALIKNLSKLKLSPTAKLVLLSLSTYYNPNKPAYPKQETIAKEIGVSIASVKRAIKELSDLGLILVECKYSNHYKFTSKIFDILKLIPSTDQFETKQGVNLIPHDKNNNKINKKPFFQKNSSYSKPVEAIKIPSADKILRQREKDKETACSPLDMEKHEQIEFYNNLPDFAKCGVFGREIKKRWRL